jgi:GxxExxY protein
MELIELFKRVLDISSALHSELSTGLPKSTYKQSLFDELMLAGLKVKKQKPLIFGTEEVQLETKYQFDLLVENKILIKIKSIDTSNDIERMQTYVRLSGCKLGILEDFSGNIPKTYICEAS